MASDKDERIDRTTPATGDDTNDTAESNLPTTSVTDEGDRVDESATAGDTAPQCDVDSEMMSAPPVATSAPLDLEKLHIFLTYSTLLALTRHPSRPVVDLDMEAQVRQLDAFLARDVTEDGVATHWSAESKSSERIWQYEVLCDQLVPNLMAAIKKQSQINLNTEPKNRVNGDKKPENQSFCELYLTPNLVTMYGKLVEKSRKKGMDPDSDPWTDAVKYGKRIQLFETIYGHQYDFTDWQHTRPKPVFNQTPRLKTEEFMRVMDNRDQIRIYHRVDTPLNKVFSQLDVIPETAVKYTEKKLEKMWRDKTRPKYLIPDPATVTIPPKRRHLPWVNDDGTGKVWTRGEESWSPRFKFMVFDKGTNAYIHHHLVALDLLDEIDPNDKTWVTKYRKKITQWRARATREAAMASDHWNDEERVVVYAFSNSWVKKNGIDKFVPRIWEREKHGLVATLVNETGRARTAESVCSWARRQMVGEPNEPLGMLYAKGQEMATRVDAGDVVPDEERYPDEAIDIADSLAETIPKSFGQRKYGSKRTPDSDDESAAGGGIINGPHNFNLDGDSDRDADPALEAEDGESDDDGLPPPPPPPPSSSPLKSTKQPKLNAKGRKHLGRATSEEDATFAKSKSFTKAEMDTLTVEHNNKAAAFQADIIDKDIDMEELSEADTD